MSKWASDKNHKLIFENWRKYLDEDADPSRQDPNRFPTPLSKWASDPEYAKRITSAGADDGDPDDDIIRVAPGSDRAVTDFKPSQTNFDVMNATIKAINMINGPGHAERGMKLGGNLGGFISSDDFIMDGHHRWIATAMVDPTAPVSGYVVQYPGAQLIPVLNAITVGVLGLTKGNPGKGSKADFNAANIKNVLLSLMKGGIQGKYKKSAEYVQDAVKKHSGGLEGEQGAAAVAEKFAAGVASLNFDTPAGAPERIDMPVIDPGQVEGALEKTMHALNQGLVDVNTPDEEAAAPKAASPEEEEETPLRQAAEALRHAGRLLERAQKRHATKRNE